MLIKKYNTKASKQAVHQDFRNYMTINITKSWKHAISQNGKAKRSIAMNTDEIHVADSSKHSINAFTSQKRTFFLQEWLCTIKTLAAVWLTTARIFE